MLMPVATLLYLLAAGVALQAGFTHVIAGVTRRPRDRVHISFAVLAFAASAFTVSTWAAHVATTPAAYIAIFKGPWVASATLALVALAWFVAYWTDVGPRRFLLGLSVAAGLLLVVNLRAPQGVILRGVTELREVRFPFGEPMALHVAVDGPSPLVSLVNVAVVGFVVFAVYREIRRRGFVHTAPIVTALTLLLAASAYDGLVDAGLVSTPYVMPLAMVGIVVLMSLRLARELRRREDALARQADDLRAAVEERTGQLRAANAALTRRVDELDGLRRVAHITARPGRLRAALDQTLGVLGPLVGAAAAAIRVEAWEATGPITVSWRDAAADGDATRHLHHVLASTSSAVRWDDPAVPFRVTRMSLSPGDDVEGIIVLIDGGEPHRTVDRGLIGMVASDVVALVLRHRLLDALRDAATAEERRRISRELHESVTQTLYSVSMLAEALPGTYEQDPDLGRRALGQLRELSLVALAELRELLAELRPVSTETTSLRSLLQEQADNLATRFQVPVDVIVHGDPSPSGEVKVVIRRVVRELLSNVARHANATRVGLHVRQSTDGGGSIEVVDDGSGFDPDAVGAAHHGLAIARERLASVDGTLELRTTPGAGTCAVLRWPPTPERREDPATLAGDDVLSDVEPGRSFGRQPSEP